MRRQPTYFREETYRAATSIKAGEKLRERPGGGVDRTRPQYLVAPAASSSEGLLVDYVLARNYQAGEIIVPSDIKLAGVVRGSERP